jgi:hypothetical protein
MKTIIALITLATLTGCGGSYWERQEADRINKLDALSEQARQRDSNPNETAYNDGAKAGYSSGLNTTGDWTSPFIKDVTKYVDNKYYKAGWDDGFAKGKGIGDQSNRIIDHSIYR